MTDIKITVPVHVTLKVLARLERDIFELTRGIYFDSNCSVLTLRALMLFFISTCITPDNELLTVKYACNLETLVYTGT